ncbi:MAG: hypothetical protein FJ398_15555 [Verrucomicrobia bacterium]|nr:hypothetical protein [Verrucomicrobiota bacterium]
MLKSLLLKVVALAMLSAVVTSTAILYAADPVFSGPQAGEKTTPFKVADFTASTEAKERDPITENHGAPTALVFLHGLERSMVPLMTTIDMYGADQKEKLKTEFIFLSADRLSGEQRLKAAASSLKLQSRRGVSLDGEEGPGNYGLNKECLMTIVVAKDNKVTANFALVQPGIADAPQVLSALAAACGDQAPPTVEALQARRGQRPGMADRRAMAAEGAAARGEKPEKPKEDFPGKPPTDAKLLGLLRRFIQPANDDVAVDQVLREVNEYIAPDAALRQQAIDGWTRVLHFKDRYGTAYARQQGQAALDKWKQQK